MEMIKAKGTSIAPTGHGDTLFAYPAVANVAIIGVRDVTRGVAPRASVVLQQQGCEASSQMAAQFIAFARQRKHQSQWLVGGFIFLQDIPKAAKGKILRRVLRNSVQPPAKSVL